MADVYNSYNSFDRAGGDQSTLLKKDDTIKKPVASSDKNILTCRVHLLDNTDYDLEINKNSTGQVLFDKVCEYLNLLEKDYFSISYKELVQEKDKKQNQQVKFWVIMDKQLVKQAHQPTGEVFYCNFELKFYPPEPGMLKEDLTRYFVCLQVRNDILSNTLPASFVTVALLGAYTIQAALGNFDQSVHGNGIDYMKDFVFAPNQNDELLYRVSDLHRILKGQLPAEADQHFLQNAKKVSLYGVHLHPARREKPPPGMPSEVLVGVYSEGLLIYNAQLRTDRYSWARILKIEYRNLHFIVDLRPPEGQKKKITVTFALPNYRLAKRLWRIAVEHHTFFRMREAELAVYRSFPMFHSKYHYQHGRTNWQANQDMTYLDRANPNVRRFGSDNNKRQSRSDITAGQVTERGEQYAPDVSKTATLDLKGKRKGSKALLDISTADETQPMSSEMYQPYGGAQDGKVDLGTNPDSQRVAYSKTTATTNYLQQSAGGWGSNQPNATTADPSQRYSYGDPSRGGVLPTEKDENGRVVTRNVQVVTTVTTTKQEVRGGPGAYPSQEDKLARTDFGSAREDGQWGQPGVASSLQKTTTTTTKGGHTTVETEVVASNQGVTNTTYSKETHKAAADDDDDDEDDGVDYDGMLAEAIKSVTDMNPDLAVEKIEIQAKK